MNIIVADSKAHAKALIDWLGLSEDWQPAAYGDKLIESYDFAKIVRPLQGVEQKHFDWILETLVPRVGIQVDALPSCWKLRPPDEPEDQPQKRATA